MLRIRRPLDRGLLVASMLLALGLGLVVTAFATASTGRDSDGLPDPIELVSPGPGDNVLRQTAVSVDLMAGHSGRLVIDGVELETVEVTATAEVEPGQDVGEDILVTRFDPGSRILTYQPQEGALIASFATGVHEVKVIYWNNAEPERARSFTWQFRVTA